MNIFPIPAISLLMYIYIFDALGTLYGNLVALSHISRGLDFHFRFPFARLVVSPHDLRC